MTLCSDCNHESHEANHCEHDNCGESEISSSDAVSKFDKTRIVTFQNFSKTEVSTVLVTHIKPRVSLPK